LRFLGPKIEIHLRLFDDFKPLTLHPKREGSGRFPPRFLTAIIVEPSEQVVKRRFGRKPAM